MDWERKSLSSRGPSVFRIVKGKVGIRVSMKGLCMGGGEEERRHNINGLFIGA